jgi:hypothetical protein
MKSIFVSLVCLLSTVCSFAQAPATDWAITINGSGPDGIMAVTTSTSGNIYSSGYYTGTWDFDPTAATSNLTAYGQNDMFLAKHDRYGHLIWAKSFGGKGYDYLISMNRDEHGNLYMTGYFTDSADLDPGPGTSLFRTAAPTSSEGFLLKTDSSGNLIFAVQSISLNYMGAKSDEAGNIYAYGFFNGTADFNPGTDSFKMTSAGGRDVFISKFNASGSFIWAKRIGGTGLDGIAAVTITGDKLYIAASYQTAADVDPGPGVYNLSGVAGKDNAFLLKLDTAGNFNWAKGFKGTDHHSFVRLFTSSGYLYAASNFMGTVDFDPGPDSFKATSNGGFDMAIVKLDTAGKFVWAKAFGGKGLDLIFDLAQDSIHTLCAGGYFDSTVDFDPGPAVFNRTVPVRQDAFLLKLDTAGAFKWVDILSSPKSDDIRSIAFDPWGNVIACGEYGDTADFDNGPGLNKIPCVGTFDGFLLKLGNAAPDSNTTVSVPTINHWLLTYPNPATGSVVISGPEELSTIKVFDLSGRPVQVAIEATFRKTTIGIATLASGCYFIEAITTTGAIHKGKFVKQ